MKTIENSGLSINDYVSLSFGITKYYTETFGIFVCDIDQLSGYHAQ